MHNPTNERIAALKKEKNALILAHYYQPLEVQAVADYVGDSFALAKRAQESDQDVIIMCGVLFMAESAKILNPDKTVYLPAADAGCPMADMITAQDVLDLKKEYPDAAVVCYVNSSAAVKAVSDVCCTSSSAMRIVNTLGQKRIIFVPDRNLGAYIASQAPHKEIILFDGCCPIHDEATEEHVNQARARHPNAKLLAHPECSPQVLRHADFIGSTTGIIDYAKASDLDEFIIGTEMGVVDILQRDAPDKKFFPLREDFTCHDMKKISLEAILHCLEGNCVPIQLSSQDMAGARRSLERMMNS